MVRRTAFALAALALVTAGSRAGSAAPATQSVDDIVAKNYATRGGPEKWKSLQTQKMTGSATGQGAEVGLVVYSKRPNLARQEITINIPGQGAINMVSIFDGTKAYSTNPMSGSDALAEMPAAEAESVREQSDFDGALLDYKSKGHTAELIGVEAVGTKKAHHIKLTRKGQPTQHYYIDVDTGVELKVKTEAGIGPESEAEFSDYRAVNGVQVPHLIRILSNGTLQGELRVDTVEFNVAIPDSMFRVK